MQENASKPGKILLFRLVQHGGNRQLLVNTLSEGHRLLGLIVTFYKRQQSWKFPEGIRTTGMVSLDRGPPPAPDGNQIISGESVHSEMEARDASANCDQGPSVLSRDVAFVRPDGIYLQVWKICMDPSVLHRFNRYQWV